MLTKHTAHLLTLALQKRASANQVEWVQFGEMVGVIFNDLLLKYHKSSGDSGRDITFEVDTPAGKKVGVIQIKTADAEYKDFDELLSSATMHLSDWDHKLLETASLIEQSAGKVGSHPRFEIPSPPPPPERPTEEQALAFFEKISGDWGLEFETNSGGTGTEILRIDRDGNYFTTPYVGRKLQGAVASARPKYRLSLITCDADLTHVEVAKQELNGKTRQIEVLAISADEMSGYAKHDEHKLRYRRPTTKVINMDFDPRQRFGDDPTKWKM